MHLPSRNTPRRSDGHQFLGLIFDNEDWDKGRYYPSFHDNGSVLFTNILACFGGGSTRRGSEDPKIAVAVEAGLGPLMPMAVEASSAAGGAPRADTAAQLAPARTAGGARRNGGITMPPIDDNVGEIPPVRRQRGGERAGIGRASRTLEHRCPPLR